MKYNRFLYKLADKLHLTMYHRTMRAKDRIEYSYGHYDKLCALYKLIKYLHKHMYIEGFDTLDINLSTLSREATWITVANDLFYYSDRWCWSRLNRIILLYNELNNSRFVFRAPKRNLDD